MNITGGGVDLTEEGEIEVVRSLESLRVTGEGQAGRLQVKFQVLLGNVGNGDGEVDEVLLRVGVGGALSP